MGTGEERLCSAPEYAGATVEQSDNGGTNGLLNLHDRRSSYLVYLRALANRRIYDFSVRLERH